MGSHHKAGQPAASQLEVLHSDCLRRIINVHRADQQSKQRMESQCATVSLAAYSAGLHCAVALHLGHTPHDSSSEDNMDDLQPTPGVLLVCGLWHALGGLAAKQFMLQTLLLNNRHSF